MMATAMAISTATTKAHDHPPYKEMIVSAIDSLKDRKGSSKTAIAKYIASNYNDLPPTHDALLTTHLRRLKQKGTIQMIKHSYKLAVLNDADSGPKKRGRPPKKLKPDNAAVGTPGPKKRGRPPKKLNPDNAAVGATSPKKRGRPRKKLKPDNAAVGTSDKRKPGRPKKAAGDGKRRAGRPRKEMALVAELILPRNLKLKLKPGRPKKANSADVAVSGEKRMPGRPRKQIPAAATVSSEQKKPGRAKKALGAVENGGGSKLGEKRKPGRSKKASTPLSSAVKGTGGPLGATKRRGRPPKEGKPAVVAKTGSEVKRSVGRPRKNVET